VCARLDDHSEFGTQFSPRISILFRPDDLTVRASYGHGYFAPTPSLDINYQFNQLETGITLVSSIVENVTELETFSSQIGGPFNRVRLTNATGESRIYGSEPLLT
jgi:outer membrane receptor for ferrienterochelin and colicins